VTSLDWQTGQPNAKYWVTNLLATTVGDSQPKQIVTYNLSGSLPPVKPGLIAAGSCGIAVTTVSDCNSCPDGTWNATTEGIETRAWRLCPEGEAVREWELCELLSKE
jgi:hypothetical protein